MDAFFTLAIAFAACIGLACLITGALVRGPKWQKNLLWGLRVGFGLAGVLYLVSAVMTGDTTGWIFGPALLVVATAVSGFTGPAARN